AAPGVRVEFGPRSLDFQAYHRGAWRPHLGGKPSAGSGPRRDALGARGALHRAAAGDVMADQTPTVHASAVLAGARAVLIRGPAGGRQSPTAPSLLPARPAGARRVAPP